MEDLPDFKVDRLADPRYYNDVTIRGLRYSDKFLILIDGVRSNDEIEVLKKFGTVKLLAVHASTDTRFDFLQKRGRSDDPQTKEHFEERDNRELGVCISNSIALSDYAISNVNLTKDELIEQTFKIKLIILGISFIIL